MRTIVDMPDEQVERLTLICRREGISRAEAVRRAVSAYLEDNAQSAEEEVFGIWRKRKLDGLRYQDELRSEWP